MVIVDADPLLNISNTRRVYRVVKGGEVYDPKELIAAIQ
jgi:imidazolonepropionase-like amidohydrolase